MKFSLPLYVLPILAGWFAFAGVCDARTVGSGKLANEARTVSGFHGVELACGGTLDIIQDDKEELVVEAEDNLLPLIETTVKADGVLLLRFKDHEDVRATKSLSFKLSVKALDRIVLSGSGSIHAAGKLTAENETVRLPGSGKITLDSLETGALTIKLEGSGAIRLAGGASSQSVQLDGSGNYEAGAFKTDTTKIVVNGSGSCKVWTEKRLEVNVNGSGTIGYYGHPKVRRRVAGSGDVRSLGGKGS